MSQIATLSPLEALTKVLTALGFEFQPDEKGRQSIVHTASGTKLKVVWHTSAFEDLQHFHGVDGALELASLIVHEVWSVATTGKSQLFV